MNLLPSLTGYSLGRVMLLYFVAYVANVLLTKLVTSGVTIGPLLPTTDLGVLPFAMVGCLLFTFLFIGVSGWHRDAHAVRVAGLRLPMPTRYTALSAVGSALVICTVPVSFTFADVSIPFMQLMMRGNVLILAPLVDLAFRRRVHWRSWVALVTVAFALILVVWRRGGLHLPPLAIIVVSLYTLGYLLRLALMTHVAKGNDPAAMRRYFVEEKLLSLPLAVVALAVLAFIHADDTVLTLPQALLTPGSSAILWMILGVGLTLATVSVSASIILLHPHENTFCVPIERSTSLLAGIGAAWVLHLGWGFAPPTSTEMLGAVLLVGAIVLLTHRRAAQPGVLHVYQEFR